MRAEYFSVMVEMQKMFIDIYITFRCNQEDVFVLTI